MHKQLRQNRGRLPVSAPSPHPHYAKQTQSPYRWRLAGIPSLHCAKQTQFAVPPASCRLRTPPFPRNEPNLPCPQHPAGFAPPPFAQNEPNFASLQPLIMRSEPNPRTGTVPARRDAPIMQNEPNFIPSPSRHVENLSENQTGFHSFTLLRIPEPIATIVFMAGCSLIKFTRKAIVPPRRRAH